MTEYTTNHGGRRFRLADLNPRFTTYDGKDDHPPDCLTFDCPEGHEDCRYHVPFAPGLGGPGAKQRDGVTWARTGDTFETLTLAPSIKGIPKFENEAEAIAKLDRPEHRHVRMWCHLHIFIKNGAIEFCSDSR